MSAAELARWYAWFLAQYWANNPDQAPPRDSDDPEEHSRMIDSIL